MVSYAAKNKKKILVLATKGSGSNDENRIRALVSNFTHDVFRFDYESKWNSFWRLLESVRYERPDLIVMEGSGIAGGIALILSKFFYKTKYIVSSGDAIGPFFYKKFSLLSFAFTFYEFLLYRMSTGVIGWTPYLVGRALTFGATKAMTAEGWANFYLPMDFHDKRESTRRKIGVRGDSIVIGIVGSLQWNSRISYGYGLDLIQALNISRSSQIELLIIGEGNALPHLLKSVSPDRKAQVHFTGFIPEENLIDYYSAMDIVTLSQSADSVGNFRYTIKLSEYYAADLLVLSTQIPLTYDLDNSRIIRLPGISPWDKNYIHHLAEFMRELNWEKLRLLKRSSPNNSNLFNREKQISRATSFISDIISR